MGYYDDDDRYDDPPRRRSRYDNQEDYDDPYRRDRHAYEPPRPRKHSGFGIASLVVVLASGALVLLCFAILVAISSETDADLDENDPATVLMVGGVFIGLAFCLIGIVLGIIGCFQQRRNKVCAIVGLVLGCVVVFGGCGLIALGAAASASGM